MENPVFSPGEFVSALDQLLKSVEKTKGYTVTDVIAESPFFKSFLGWINPPSMKNYNPRAYAQARCTGNMQVEIKSIDPRIVPGKIPLEKLKKLVAALKKHCKNDPHIAPIYDVALISKVTYIISEHLPGEDILTFMGYHDNNESVCRDIAGQVINSLRKATICDITHKLLNPDCIRVDGNGKAKIAGLGLPAKLLSKNSLMEKYKAPEVRRGERKQYTKEANIYALGVILYEALHGYAPSEVQEEEPTFGNISNDAKMLLAGMLHPEYWQRPTMTECLLYQWFGQKDGLPNKEEAPAVLKQKRSSESHVNKKTATVNCGSEKVLLRSRIPNKATSYAAGANHVQMYANTIPFKKDRHIFGDKGKASPPIIDSMVDEEKLDQNENDGNSETKVACMASKSPSAKGSPLLQGKGESQMSSKDESGRESGLSSKQGSRPSKTYSSYSNVTCCSSSTTRSSSSKGTGSRSGSKKSVAGSDSITSLSHPSIKEARSLRSTPEIEEDIVVEQPTDYQTIEWNEPETADEPEKVVDPLAERSPHERPVAVPIKSKASRPKFVVIKSNVNNNNNMMNGPNSRERNGGNEKKANVLPPIRGRPIAVDGKVTRYNARGYCPLPPIRGQERNDSDSLPSITGRRVNIGLQYWLPHPLADNSLPYKTEVKAKVSSFHGPNPPLGFYTGMKLNKESFLPSINKHISFGKRRGVCRSIEKDLKRLGF